MKRNIWFSGFVLLITASSFTAATEKCDYDFLHDILNGILQILQRMDSDKEYLNLDGVLGIRMIADQLPSLIETVNASKLHGQHALLLRLQYLQSMAQRIADVGELYVQKNQKEYFKAIGGNLKSGFWRNFTYPARRIRRELQEEMPPCVSMEFFPGFSDQCMHKLMQYREDGSSVCKLVPECVAYIIAKHQKDYILTHQVFHLEIAQNGGCLPALERYPHFRKESVYELQNRLCANVLRDAEACETAGYPADYHDLFIEQIGLCGIYGFTDFFKRKWTEKILSLQKDGCYHNKISNRPFKCYRNLAEIGKVRVKRHEVTLPDGCSSHVGSVALVALAPNLRYCVESLIEQYNDNEKNVEKLWSLP